jgi:hypothetical protein
MTDDSWNPVGVSGIATGGAAVAAGEDYACARTSAGALRCWGANTYGQLGNGLTSMSEPLPVGVIGLSSGAAAVSTGGGHACVLMDVAHAGAVRCWGANGFGQLGEGTLINSSVPMTVTGLASGGAVVTAGANHTCARMDAGHGGGLKCWGNNFGGQLGVNPGWAPVNVAGFTDYTIYDLSYTRSGTALVMAWASLGPTIGHYEVYRANRPYFAPGPIDVTDLGSVPPPPYGATSTYTDTTTFAAPPSALYYLLQTVDLASQGHSASTHPGGIGFSMVPGTP